MLQIISGLTLDVNLLLFIYWKLLTPPQSSVKCLFSFAETTPAKGR